MMIQITGVNNDIVFDFFYQKYVYVQRISIVTDRMVVFTVEIYFYDDYMFFYEQQVFLFVFYRHSLQMPDARNLSSFTK